MKEYADKAKAHKAKARENKSNRQVTYHFKPIKIYRRITMKYTNALCEKDFTIIKQLNKFTDQETLLQSIDKLIANANLKTAERLTTLYPIRLKELRESAYIYYMNEEFADCTIPIAYNYSQDTNLNKYYVLYGEKVSKTTGRRYIFHKVNKAPSRKLALIRSVICGKNKINKEATKMISSTKVFGKEWIVYSHIREIKEEIIDLKTVADNYFMETGIRLLEDVSTLVLKNHYNESYSSLKSSIYENGFYVGITSDLNFSVLRSTKIDKKTMNTLLWYYIGFTPEQIEYKLSYESC